MSQIVQPTFVGGQQHPADEQSSLCQDFLQQSLPSCCTFRMARPALVAWRLPFDRLCFCIGAAGSHRVLRVTHFLDRVDRAESGYCFVLQCLLVARAADRHVRSNIVQTIYRNLAMHDHLLRHLRSGPADVQRPYCPAVLDNPSALGSTSAAAPAVPAHPQRPTRSAAPASPC